MKPDPQSQHASPQTPHTTTATVGPRIALLGDLHCFTRRFLPWQLIGKRIGGALNVWFHRGKHLRMDLIPVLNRRIETIDPTTILAPGDLTMTALPREYAMVKQALGPLLDRYDLLTVAGNHDRYTFTSARAKRFEFHFPKQTVTDFPHHRELASGVHVVAIDTAKPNVMGDLGRVGDEQLGALATMLKGLPAGEPVIVLSHYTIGTPPGDKPEKPSHRLIDEADLIAALRESDRQILFIHGHVHRPWCYRHPVATNVVSLDTGAPTLTSAAYPAGQGLWELERGPDGWQITRHKLDSNLNWAAQSVVWPLEPGQVAAV